MLGRERVPLSSITWTLTPSVVPDDLGPLSRSMKERIHHRPLLNRNLECVDGARQLEVFKQWGVTYVDVIVTDDLDFTMKVLAQRHDAADYPDGVCRHPASPRRVERFHEILQPQIRGRLRKIRQESGKARRTGVRSSSGPTVHYRSEMARIVGLSNETIYSRYIALLGLFHEAKGEEKRVIADLLDRIELRKISIYNAESLHRKWLDRNTDKVIASVDEQTVTITNALSMLSGLIPALSSVTPLNPDHDPENLKIWARQLSAQVKALYQYSRTLQGSAT